MGKVLILASVASMLDQFNMSNISILKSQGYDVHVAANFEYGSTSSKQRVDEFKIELDKLNVRYHHVEFSRKILDIFSNLQAYRIVKKLMLAEKYEFIHCHSPIGGVCGRLAARTTNTTVIYTAHGFHFFKGGPIKSWILYYPVERLLSYLTDVLITINHEDFLRAKKSFGAKRVEYIPGVGLDTNYFSEIVINRYMKRKEICVPVDAVMLFSVGELGERKNHETPIRALAKTINKNIYYVICGVGELKDYLTKLACDLGVADRVLLLGFRSDIAELCKISDIYVFPSRREGLGIAGLEGMASGLPLISSYINGIRDYTKNGETGYCLEPFDVEGFSIAIDKLAGDVGLRERIGKNNLNVVKNFDINVVDGLMDRIYKSVKV
jgi:glycosyltransferase involved in cell wall biosynthesis